MFLGERKGGLQWFGEESEEERTAYCREGEVIKLVGRSLRKVRILR
jgi:hypothetical protein